MSRSKNERNWRRGRPDSPANIGWWRAQTESAIQRHSTLRARAVADADFLRAWRGHVAAVRKATAAWPSVLADRVGSITDPEMICVLGWADEPRLEGVVYPDPMLRPLFQQLTDALTGSPAERDLVRVLEEPAALPAPPKPTSSLRAREQYRTAAAALKRRMTESQRGVFRRRDAALAAIEDAQARFRQIWFTVWPANVDGVAGDQGKAFRFATRLRDEALATLARLDGPAPPAAELLADVVAEKKKSERPKRRKRR